MVRERDTSRRTGPFHPSAGQPRPVPALTAIALLLYLLGALVGHGIGETFQPHQSGMSVAFAGILGGIGPRVLLGHDLYRDRGINRRQASR